MFTGLVEEIGRIQRVLKKQGSIIFSVSAPTLCKKLTVMESVSVNGVCLTVIRKRGNVFDVQAVEETLTKTTLGGLKSGSEVNLEQALPANGRIGGHFVLGHVDTTATIAKIDQRKSSRMLWIKIPRRFVYYLIPVGSVAINGVSLTVALLSHGECGVSIIPYTMEQTTFRSLRVGEQVNVEFDVLGKYVQNFLKVSRKGLSRSLG
jgi:riboflavin synthase